MIPLTDTLLLKHILLSVYLTMSWKTDAGVPYLKSNGDIKILEGEVLKIGWTTYKEQKRVPPCSWRYAVSSSEAEDTFLAYDGEIRYNFNMGVNWNFTKSGAPCDGGIQKQASLADTGIYTMEVNTGYKWEKEESETFVNVYRASDLTFRVIVNDKTLNLDLIDDSKLKIDGMLQTSKPINVIVILSEVFPPTTITIARTDIICDDVQQRCSKTIDLANSDSSIIIKLRTGIRGADTIVITQPVSRPSNHIKVVAITFGVLFFILFLALIGFIMICVWGKRKNKKSPTLEDSTTDSKNRLCVRIAKLLNNDKADSLRGMINVNQMNCQTKKKQFNQLVHVTHQTAKQVLVRCDEELEELAKMKPENEIAASSNIEQNIIELHIAATTGIKTVVTYVEEDVKCYEDYLNDRIVPLLPYNEVNPEDEETDNLCQNEEQQAQNETMLVSLADVLQHQDRIIELQALNMKLEFMSAELDRATACIQQKKARIDSVKNRLNTIQQSVQSLTKGDELENEAAGDSSNKWWSIMQIFGLSTTNQ